MNTHSPHYVLLPLRSAVSEMRDAARAAQSDFAGGTKSAKDHLQTGLMHALNEVANTNARLQEAIDEVAAAARASGKAARKRSQDFRRNTGQRFSALRQRAVSEAGASWNGTLRHSRDASRRVQEAALSASNWASRNPRLTVAIAVTACCLAVARYRRRRAARLAAAEKSARRKTRGNSVEHISVAAGRRRSSRAESKKESATEA